MDKLPITSHCASAAGSVLELPWLERTLLWSIRTWAAYHDAPQSIWWHLERVFTEAGIRPALEPFSQLMHGLFGGLKRLPDIRCVRCLRLGKDEKELLAILAQATQQSAHATTVRLGRLMSFSAARGAAAAALEIMRVVHGAGLSMQITTAELDSTERAPTRPFDVALH
ncbi:MAG: hypothetical protein QM808_12100 [Steroidobacteraceae bacterium]